MPSFRTLPVWKNATRAAAQRRPAATVAAIALLLSGCAPLPNSPQHGDAVTGVAIGSPSAAAAAASTYTDANGNGSWMRWGNQRAEAAVVAKMAPPAPDLKDLPDPLEMMEGETEVVPERASDQRGMASWYGPGFHGRLTANGERFNQTAMTAAHPTLPFGTQVCVRSTVNGKAVVVRINDRGPYAKGRVIDLSKAAAEELGMMGLGVKRVELWALQDDEAGCPGEEVPRQRDDSQLAQNTVPAAPPESTSPRNALNPEALRALEHYRLSQSQQVQGAN